MVLAKGHKYALAIVAFVCSACLTISGTLTNWFFNSMMSKVVACWIAALQAWRYFASILPPCAEVTLPPSADAMIALHFLASMDFLLYSICSSLTRAFPAVTIFASPQAHKCFGELAEPAAFSNRIFQTCWMDPSCWFLTPPMMARVEVHVLARLPLTMAVM